MDFERISVKRLFLLLLVAGSLIAPAYANTQIHARVKGDRVNLRAKSDMNSETVGQVAAGTLLKVLSIEGDWVQVVPPEATDFWVHKEFIENDTVLVNRLNVRSGAGINYSVVGSYNRGEKVVRRGSFGEWVKVAPPADASLWVSASLLDLVYPAAPVPPPIAAPAARSASIKSDAAVVTPTDTDNRVAIGTGRIPPATPPTPPADLNLVPLDGQGRIIQKEGQLKRSPVLLFNAPGSHRLVVRDGKRLITTAYVRGNTKQLDSLLDEYLIVQGREYWVEKGRVPVIVIDSIEKRSFLQP